MTHTAEIFTSSVVAVGDFNPAIFSPDWLERNKLIGDGDALIATEGSQGRPLLVSRQVTAYESKWFALQVIDNQLSLTSKGVLSPALKDLAVGIFQLVSHTPVRAVGLNFVGHYKLANLDEYHAIGDILAPKDIWDALFPDEVAGTEQITIRFQPGTREKPVATKDEKRITVQPSRSLTYGVGLSINDHYDVSVSSDSELTSAEKAAVIIDEQWEATWKDSVRAFDQVLSLAVRK